MLTKSIDVKGTIDIPTISFKPNGYLFISGRSLPINASKVYQPLVEFIENIETQYVTLLVDLEYTNASTVKWLYNMIKAIDNNSNITFCYGLWYYGFEDTCSLVTGKILNSISQKCKFDFQVKFPFN